MAKQTFDALSDEQLVHKELELERELIAASFRQKTGQLEDSARLGRIRRDIARLRTAQRAREIAQGLGKDSLRNRFRATFVAGQAASASAGEASGGFLKGIVDKIGG